MHREIHSGGVSLAELAEIEKIHKDKTVSHLLKQEAEKKLRAAKADYDAALATSQKLLSDQTRVGIKIWSDVKKAAMQADYKKDNAWYNTLGDEDKQVLDALVEAQREQGDMLALQPVPFQENQEAAAAVAQQ